MKIKPEHIQYMKDNLPLARYAEYLELTRANPKVHDAELAARWCLFNTRELRNWLVDVLYTYANDTHIDTALRNITKGVK